MTTPSDLKAALVEAMARKHWTVPEDKWPTLSMLADMEDVLASLPPVLERFGCKVTRSEAAERKMREAGAANRFLQEYQRVLEAEGRAMVGGPVDAGLAPLFAAYEIWGAMHDAAPTVPWEEK